MLPTPTHLGGQYYFAPVELEYDRAAIKHPVEFRCQCGGDLLGTVTSSLGPK